MNLLNGFKQKILYINMSKENIIHSSHKQDWTDRGIAQP